VPAQRAVQLGPRCRGKSTGVLIGGGEVVEQVLVTGPELDLDLPPRRYAAVLAKYGGRDVVGGDLGQQCAVSVTDPAHPAQRR
jgi:hypothetical protein